MSTVTFATPDTIASPVAPYSQAAAVKIGDTEIIFVAGQWSTDVDGNLVGEDDMFAQTQQTLRNIELALGAHGASFQDVFKMNIYVTDIEQRQHVSEARKAFLPDPPPISTILEVTKLALPGLLIEIEAVAVKSSTR